MWLEEEFEGGQDVKKGAEIPRFHKTFAKAFPNPLHCPERQKKICINPGKLLLSLTAPAPGNFLPGLDGVCIKAPWS